MLEKIFPPHQHRYQNIKFTMEEESNGELAFLDILLNCINIWKAYAH